MFLGSFWRSVGRLLSKRFSVHRVESCEVLYHQPLFQPVSSFVHLFECMRANTDSRNSFSWSQFGVEICSHNLYALLAEIRVLLDCLARFFPCDGQQTRVVKVHAPQLDATVVDRNGCSCGPFVDVITVDDSFSQFLVQQISYPVFVLIFSTSRVDVLLMRFPNF